MADRGGDNGNDLDMQAVEDTIAALGQPVLVRALGTPASAAMIARWRHGPGVVEVRPSTTIRLAMSLVDARNARSRSGRGAKAGRAESASVSIFSPAEGVSVEVGGEADVVLLFLDQSHVDTMLDAPIACPPMFDLHDDGIRNIVMRILVGSARAGVEDALRMEEDLQALALRIARHADRRRGRLQTPSMVFRGGLAPAAFRRVEAMIETALDQAGSPGLAEMAKSTGLSVTHFVRAFGRHTGRTPHQYLVQRRLERAVSLLRTARISVADVAEAAGFSTPAHFVATFRRAMGVTPGALREALVG